MTDKCNVPDAAERLRAIDPAYSFIVQAPAGSGKTGLLIQRYLRLLAGVDEPEEIVAITFTRKAALEMRERILHALNSADKTFAGGNVFEQLTHKLATAAIQRDRQAGWHIIENPARLRIQTIDALCASLTRQMPVLSKFGSQPRTIEDASQFYLEAVRATAGLLDQRHAIADDLEMLLEHLDNDVSRIERLLTGMLARRDHWLRHIHGKTREELEASLRNLRQEAVEKICSLMPEETHSELFELAGYAAANLLLEQRSSTITLCNALTALPDTVEPWHGIAELLLKADGEWRARVDSRQGFPAGKTKTDKENAKAWKKRMDALIGKLGTSEALLQALKDVRQLPPPTYSESQWEILGAITRILPHAVAQLKIIFQLAGQVDFTEVSQSALAALGTVEAPTDLALVLDYRIKHLLIDEFQDTSISQYLLIEKLVAGWEAGDGRSLFAVGDPMQSIYRFREAEVGLFLQARHSGIGDIDLQPITLVSNFRSQCGIVDWVNATFKQIMPAFEDIAVGAVAYTPSVAVLDRIADQAVTVHPFFEKNRHTEAERVVDVVLQCRQKNPTDSIAILVRNRSHLSEIVTCLKASGLRFRAVEIEALNQKPVVQDMLMLTRALLNPSDNLAWLSVLRAPWCGLRLEDLQALGSTQVFEHNKQGKQRVQTIWELLSKENNWSDVSVEGVKRLRRVRTVFEQCMQNRCRQSLRTTVEAAWQMLGGPGCINREEMNARRHVLNQNIQRTTSLNDAMNYLEYLEKHEHAGNIQDILAFEEGLSKLFASTDLRADNCLQIMTIHKSKGLEFDTVLVPGLGFAPKIRERQLLNWMEQPRNRCKADSRAGNVDMREVDLFLAPIHETGKENDPINQWMELKECEKENYEAERLLYVAATRARKFLHLFGHIKAELNDGEWETQQPRSKSLLKRLWPAVESVYLNPAVKKQGLLDTTQYTGAVKDNKVDRESEIDQSIVRLLADWKLPSAPDPIRWKSPLGATNLYEEIEFSWASEIARHVGTVVHRWLLQIAEDDLEAWSVQRIQSMRQVFSYGLIKDGLSVDIDILDQAVERVIIALVNTIMDERGRWILGQQQEAQNELKLTGVIDDKTVHYVIDRTFCDANNRRWIIDYKTSAHEGAGVELFLDREQERYCQQLNKYGVFIQRIDTRPIYLGLYFPMLKKWRAWKKSDYC